MSKNKATGKGRRESFVIPSETAALFDPDRGDIAEFIRTEGEVIREATPRELRVGFVYPILEEETETNVTMPDETTLNLGAASSGLLLNEGSS
jgi:hypothetical protein